MIGTAGRRLARKVGTVGVYTAGSSLALVRQARTLAGRVTVAGFSGRRALCELAADGDLYGIDLDPAVYLERNVAPPQSALFDLDWEAWQRERGLPVIRSCGAYVRRKDVDALTYAFTTPVGSETIRVVSLESWWIRDGLTRLLEQVRGCDDALAFVLADCFDPLAGPGAVDGLRMLADSASDGGRRVELLRTDLAAIGFAALGGTWATIGTNTSTRHHGLPQSRRAAQAYGERQSSPYVFVPELLSWQHGMELGALTPFGGAGITSCDCPVCNGDDLLRFARSWPGRAPAAVRREAQLHDLHCCASLARNILGSVDPATAWAQACRRALSIADGIAAVHKVRLRMPASLSAWR